MSLYHERFYQDTELVWWSLVLVGKVPLHWSYPLIKGPKRKTIAKNDDINPYFTILPQ